MRTLVRDTPGKSPDPAEALAGRWTSRLAPAAIAGIVAAGVVLRFVASSPLWLDEALSANIAALPVGDLFEALRHDGHPPFYYLLLHGWMELFGQGDVAVRTLSGIFGVAALPLAWVAGRRLAGVAGGQWALVVFALSPYLIRYSTETRMYSLVMLLVLAGYLLVVDALEAPSAWRLGGIALLSGLLLLTHYWAFYLLAAVVIVLAARWRRSPADRPATARVIAATAAGGLLFLPWLGGFLYQAAHTGTPWAGPLRPTQLVSTTLNDVGGGTVAEALLGGTAVLLLALVALFTVRAAGHQITFDVRTAPTVRTELTVVALTAAIGCVAGYATNATYQSRYAAVFVPLLLLAAAVGITRIPGVARLVVGGIFVVLAVGGIVWVHYYQRTQADVAARVIAPRAEPGDVVVYCPDQLGPAYSRAIDGDPAQLSYPTLASPDRVDWVDYEERNAAADPQAIADQVIDRAGGNAIFVVWMSDYLTLEGQCEALVNALGRGEILMQEDGKKYYEPANVHWFPAGRAEADEAAEVATTGQGSDPAGG